MPLKNVRPPGLEPVNYFKTILQAVEKIDVLAGRYLGCNPVDNLYISNT